MRSIRSALAIGVSLAILTSAGCSSSAIDSIPDWAGGIPVGTPERPIQAAEFPPVNERPPPRDTKLITEEEQTKLERELAAARARQAVQAQEVRKSRNEMLANPPQPAGAPR